MRQKLRVRMQEGPGKGEYDTIQRALNAKKRSSDFIP